jgi:hypothetical protein
MGELEETSACSLVPSYANNPIRTSSYRQIGCGLRAGATPRPAELPAAVSPAARKQEPK